MADYTAKEYIKLQEIEEGKQSNIRNLWQETGDWMYPYVNITSTYENGVPRTKYIYDQTPYIDMCDMVSGLKQVLIPGGQNFFAIKASGNVNTDNANRWISTATEIGHEKIFASNFVTEIDEDIRNLIIFGPGVVFSEWKRGIGLNYKTCEIGTFQFIENDSKLVDSIFVKFRMTAKNAVNQFGKDCGKNVVKAIEKPETENDQFWFIHSVRPRKNRNLNLSEDYNLNMKYESCFINVIDEQIVEEKGFPENPYHIARWMRPAAEKDGRGIGTEWLPQIRVLNKLTKTFIEVGNKWGNPPLEKVANDVEGDVDTRPGAINDVMKIGSIRAIEQNALGNFPITEKSLERQTLLIDRAFYKDAFSPLNEQTGDRMTTMEIRQRIKQSWHKIGPPITRVWFEQLSKCIERSILLLIRNGEIPYPPPELSGVNFGIEFVGPFALELKSQQSKAFQEWVGIVAAMEPAFPGATDNVDSDDAVMRMGRTLGVNTEDMATEEERAAKRKARAQTQQAATMMATVDTAGKAYKNASGAAEPNSPAGNMMGVK